MNEGQREVAARLLMTQGAVLVGDVETTYRRMGAGEPVVVLGFQVDDGGRLESGLEALAARYRVIVPGKMGIAALAGSRREGVVPFAAWLRGFLEGLGIGHAGVVVTPGMAVDVRSYAAAFPGQLTKVVVTDSTEPDWIAVASALSG
ncbi:MAG: alpha/beta fold hydrolase [Gemmatimonadaceae bacterium]